MNYKIDVALNDKEHTLDGSLELIYKNNSPDTLGFIWFHLWQNAFKNDKTAFSEQALQNGDTKFYFASKEQRGYINRLDFRINNTTLKIEDHPQYSDIIKVYLNAPLAPGEQTKITTPFHVKIPDNFSRGGHNGRDKQSYQLTQWYPKPAVFDKNGWHPMPYLQQGEFYSEFGSFDVRITVPENYVVAATGVLQNAEELDWLKKRGAAPVIAEPKKQGFGKPAPKKTTGKTTSTNKTKSASKSSKGKQKKSNAEDEALPEKPSGVTPAQLSASIASAANTKTLRYIQSDVHDFAWFADKYFGVHYDTLQLASGKKVDVFSYYHSSAEKTYSNSTKLIKDAVHFRSKELGEYPYQVVSVVECPMGFEGGMEYPTITSLSPTDDEETLDMMIEHEVGHNWFYGILASNERDHPWMDEGMNTFYGYRYSEKKYNNNPGTWIGNLNERELSDLLVYSLEQTKDDLPISAPAHAFSEVGYFTITYGKTAAWLKRLETVLGKDVFDKAMRDYYEEWKFKHPSPDDFKNSIEKSSGKQLDSEFALLNKKGPISNKTSKKIKPGFLFSQPNTPSQNSFLISPAIGYNKYDGFMAGLLFHNYILAPAKFKFIVAPLYATGSKTFSGIGQASYSWLPDGRIKKVELGLSAAKFSYLDGTDSNGTKIAAGFHKLVPTLRVTLKNSSVRSTIEKWIEWKTYLIGEENFNYSIKESDGQFYPAKGTTANRYLNQLTLNVTDYRALYPYDLQLQGQQGDGFYRVNLNGNYFFNYAKGGGLNIRLFAAKFGYIGERTSVKDFATQRYQPKLTAVRGDEDYTYSNYFIGRNEADGLGGQQIMMRDGGLKLRTDIFQDLQGRSDNWVAALNFNTTIPKSLLPIPVPLRIFFDVGTYADSWKTNSNTSRFLFVGGLQVSLFKDLLNIYAPLIYSKEFRDNLKTVPEENKFGKKISFSIDIHRFNLRKLTKNKIPF